MAKASEYIVACPDCDSVDVNVDDEAGAFKCVACGAAGDLFDYVMEDRKVDFPGALRLLSFDVEERE